jgi:uncharacterized protein YjiS (DUF1127 family)
MQPPAEGTWLHGAAIVLCLPPKEKAVTTLALTRGWSRTAASNPLLFAALVVVRRIRRRLKVRADRKALHSMPDYLLTDIGISRSEIDSATEYGRGYPLGPSYRL